MYVQRVYLSSVMFSEYVCNMDLFVYFVCVRVPKARQVIRGSNIRRREGSKDVDLHFYPEMN